MSEKDVRRPSSASLFRIIFGAAKKGRPEGDNSSQIYENSTVNMKRRKRMYRAAEISRTPILGPEIHSQTSHKSNG